MIAIIPADTALHLDVTDSGRSLVLDGTRPAPAAPANCREGEGDICENETAAVTFAESGREAAAARMKMSELSTVTFTRAPSL